MATLRTIVLPHQETLCQCFLSTTFLGGGEGAMRGRAWREVEARKERFLGFRFFSLQLL